MQNRTLNSEDLAPESAYLVKALTDPDDAAASNREPSAKPAWLQSKRFTVEEGQRQIREFIHTWRLPSSWLYSLHYLGVTREQRVSVNYQGVTHDQSLTVHHYRARFSTPTARSPVVGTASVYFTMSSAAEPDAQPVDVRYVVESNRLVHRAGGRGGGGLFREKWLRDVIESKILLRQTVHDLWTGTDTGEGEADSAPSYEE